MPGPGIAHKSRGTAAGKTGNILSLQKTTQGICPGSHVKFLLTGKVKLVDGIEWVFPDFLKSCLPVSRLGSQGIHFNFHLLTSGFLYWTSPGSNLFSG